MIKEQNEKIKILNDVKDLLDLMERYIDNYEYRLIKKDMEKILGIRVTAHELLDKLLDKS